MKKSTYKIFSLVAVSVLTGASLGAMQLSKEFFYHLPGELRRTIAFESLCAEMKIDHFDYQQVKTIPLKRKVRGGSCPPKTDVAVDGENQIVRLCNSNGQPLQGFIDQQCSLRIAYSHDGRKAATNWSDRFIRLFDLETGNLDCILKGADNGVESVAFNPDGTKVIAGTIEGTVYMWDSLSGHLVRILKGHTESISSLAFSPKGDRILTGSRDKTALLWNVETGRVMQTFIGHDHPISCLAFSPDQTTVLTGATDGKVMRWNCETGKGELVLQQSPHALTSIAFSPDGKSGLVSSSDNKVYLVSFSAEADLTVKQELTLDGAIVRLVAFSPKGDSFYVGLNDGTLTEWKKGLSAEQNKQMYDLFVEKRLYALLENL